MEEFFDESDITRAIVEETAKELVDFSEVDVVIVGAGSSGLTAAFYLAKKGKKTLVLERRLSLGGGIGGGGMLFHKIVIADYAKDILDDIGCKYLKYKGNENILITDTSELMLKLGNAAINAGAKILFGISVEDVIFRENPLRISGVVIQWSAVPLAGLHVDPLMIKSKAVIDATGHDAEVVRIATKKIKELKTNVIGEKSMYSYKGEKILVEKTGEVVPGLYATGMAVAAIYNLPRMGPIFSSMLLSGRKVAEIVSHNIKDNLSNL